METHLLAYTFRGTKEKGGFRFPQTICYTYCGKQVSETEIDEKNPTCEVCFSCMVWEEIDREEPTNEQELYRSFVKEQRAKKD